MFLEFMVFWGVRARVRDAISPILRYSPLFSDQSDRSISYIRYFLYSVEYPYSGKLWSNQKQMVLWSEGVAYGDIVCINSAGAEFTTADLIGSPWPVIIGRIQVSHGK